MYPQTILFLLAAIIAVATARPLHGTSLHAHRHIRSTVISPISHRSTCRTRTNTTSSASASVKVASASAINADVESTSVFESTSSAKATSTKISSVEATSTKAASSTKASSTKASSTKASASSTKSSSSAKATATSTNTNSLLAALFPVTNSLSTWTTSTASDDALALADSTFRPTKLITDLTHNYVAAPDGKKAMQAIYPEGSYTFGHEPQGGFSFYAPGPSDVDLTTAKEVTLGYSVFFEEGYEFNKGGKLPGLYGGDTEDLAVSCSGGRRSVQCFSARLMWRTDGAGEMYTYLPDYTVDGFAANEAVCDVAPLSECNPTYGASVGRGSFTFATGGWTTISERVRLNDVGKANGELQLFVGGESVINVGGLILRDAAEGRIRGIQMQTFFGGSTSDYASPKTQSTYFSDFSVAITESL